MIEGSFGLGEAVVSGSVSPDRYVVHKGDLAITTRSVRPKELVIEPSPQGGTVTRALSPQEGMRPVLSDAEVLELGPTRHGIEAHYESPQDTEWSFDPEGKVWMLQSRPITTIAAEELLPGPEPGPGEPAPVGAGQEPRARARRGARPRRRRVRLLADPHQTAAFKDGEVLVAHMTTPDWVPLMRRAAAIVTDSGGMTCHAAIVSRELGIPCIAARAKPPRSSATVRRSRWTRSGLVIEGATAPAPAAAVRLGAAPGARRRAGAPVTATHLLGQPLRAVAGRSDGRARRRRRRTARAELMVIEALEGTQPGN